MIDDGTGWISDSSGERRADWRNSYLVVVSVSDDDERLEFNSVEIWERFGPSRRLSDETVGKIRDSLGEVASRDAEGKFGSLVSRLKPLLD